MIGLVRTENQVVVESADGTLCTLPSVAVCFQFNAILARVGPGSDSLTASSRVVGATLYPGELSHGEASRGGRKGARR